MPDLSIQTPDGQPGALFISKSVANRQVFSEGAAFTQTFVLKNIGTAAWTGCTLVRLATYGPAGKACDLLGATVSSVPVPATAAGVTVGISVSFRAARSNPKSGAAQCAPWELRRPDGTKIPALLNPTTPGKGGNVWTAVTINPSAAANVPNLSHAAYVERTMNKYVEIGNGGQCTAYVYARAKEKLNIALDKAPGSAFGNNAAGQKWVDQLTGPGKPFTFGQTPRANSIAVWCMNGNPAAGHVAFVEGVDASGNILCTEANGSSFASFAADSGPDSDSWGGGYDGRLKIVPPAQMPGHLGLGQTLRGYIHLA